MIDIDERRQQLINAGGHLLIMGGPGSGKTTIALCKAKYEIEHLKPFQKVLFLSFARATILRVITQCENVLSEDDMKLIEISTYHAFAWNVLRTHSSLISSHPIRLLLPHEAASLFCGLEANELKQAIDKEFEETGRIHFDLFAQKLYELFLQSKRITNMISDVYPVIFLDEFQDTNLYEWEMLALLGAKSTLIALADPDQRIYEFRGASPARIGEYESKFSPQLFDFGLSNHRSNGTDIVEFGNDLLTGSNQGKKYHDVEIVQYLPGFNKSDKHLRLKSGLLNCIRKISCDSADWSIAILTPSNPLMLEVSDFLLSEQTVRNGKKLPSINHNVLIDMTGPTISAILIAYLLESGSKKICASKHILEYIINHISGRKGGTINQVDKELISALNVFLNSGKIQGKNRNSLIASCDEIAELCNSSAFSGDIIPDWKTVRSFLNKDNIPCLLNLYNDSFYVRLLRKGSFLYSALSSLWRNSLDYSGAIVAVENALSQEHFSIGTQQTANLNIMTIHKSKGKEFDYVIVYEGLYNGRIVGSADRIEDAKRNLRVAVTRARRQAIILTPVNNPCELL